MRVGLACLLAVVLVGCGGGSGGSSGGDAGASTPTPTPTPTPVPEPATKDLFSVWNTTVTVSGIGARTKLDLAGKSFDVDAPMSVTVPSVPFVISGGTCNCNIQLRKSSPSISEGSFVIKFCTFDYTSSNSSDIADVCNNFADIGTYTHDAVAKTLQVCVSSLGEDCVTFK